MNLEKFTDRSKGFLENAQSLAARKNNQFLAPEHLLKVLLDDKEGVASSLLQKSGADAENVRHQVDGDVEKLPRVEGNSVQVSASQSFVKALDRAEEYATKAGDSFVTVERLLQALLAEKSYGVDARKLDQAINDMRQGRVANSPSAEDTFEAFK